MSVPSTPAPKRTAKVYDRPEQGPNRALLVSAAVVLLLIALLAAKFVFRLF